MRSAQTLGARVIARLLLPLLVFSLSIGAVAAGDADEYADEAAKTCAFLPPGLPSVFPFNDTGGCQAFDRAFPDVEDAWWIVTSYYGNVTGSTPVGDVQDLGQQLGLAATSAYGEAAVEGDTDYSSFSTGGAPTHRVIRFARGLYTVTVSGRPADAAKGQAYAKLIDQNILASMSPACRIAGMVTDFFGTPVADIRVRLHAGTVERNTATDATGHYEFVAPAGQAGYDPASDNLSVELIAEGKDQLGASSRFQVFYKQLIGGLTSDEFQVAPGADCTRDFDLHSLPSGYTGRDPDASLWPDVIEMYQQAWRSWQLAERLGVVLDYGLPLGIYGWCDPAGPALAGAGCPAGSNPNAFYVGSFLGDDVIPRPYMALNAQQSTIPKLQADQPIYHEFGHAFLADAFGNRMYSTPGRTVPHGGYYRNADSGDAWLEGFADFYRLLVRKHVDGIGAPTWYSENLELDKQPWLNTGAEEEWALAGLLLDFEDGPADYPAPKQVPMTVQRVMRSSGYLIVDARVSLADAPVDTPVVARLLDSAGNVVARGASVVRPGTTPGMGGTWIYMPDVPSATPEAFANVGAGRSGGAACRMSTAGGCDDDPIDVRFEELWATIRDRTTELAAYPHVATIRDLYLALGVAYGGDRDGDGVDDVAQIFVAHGLFADTDGGRSDHVFQSGEEIGATSHESYAAKDGTTYPQVVPRYNTVPAPEKLAAIDTGGVAAEVIVNVIFPGALNDTAGYGYVATPIDGRVLLAVPAPGTGATLALIAVADGFEPTLLATINADTFWADAEAHTGQSFSAYKATLQEAASETPNDDPDFEIPFEVPMAYVVAAGGALLLLVGFVLLRRRRARRPSR